MMLYNAAAQNNNSLCVGIDWNKSASKNHL